MKFYYFPHTPNVEIDRFFIAIYFPVHVSLNPMFHCNARTDKQWLDKPKSEFSLWRIDEASKVFGCVGLLHKKKKKILEKHFFLWRNDVIMMLSWRSTFKFHDNIVIWIYQELRRSPGGIGLIAKCCILDKSSCNGNQKSILSVHTAGICNRA